MESTTEERILLHLLNHSPRNNHGRLSFSSSQDGITNSVDASRGHVSRTLNKMIDDDLLEEKREDVGKEQKRRVKVYSLTPKGQKKAGDLRKRFLKEEFIIKTLDGKKRIKGKELKNYISSRSPILTALINVDEYGILDIAEYDKLDDHSFVDRKRELERLKESLKNVKENGSMVVSISGMAGCGKTKLCLKFKEEVENEEIHFLTGRVRKETSIPFKPFINAFRGYKYDIIDIDFEKIVEYPIDTGNHELFQTKKKAYFQEIADRIKKVCSEKPMILFLDDLQSADAATLELLTFLADELDKDPVLFLYTYRSEEVHEDHPLKDIEKELSDTDNFRNIVLNNFDLDQSREFLSELTSNEDISQNFVKLLHNLTHGNPLFLKEFVRFLIEEEKIPPYSSNYPTNEKELKIPETLKKVTKKRLRSHLSKKAHELVLFGCVIGDPIPLDLIKEMVSKKNIEPLEGVEELLEKNIWKRGSDENHFYFPHQIVSNVAYESIPSWKKKKMHLLAAEKIKKIYHGCVEDYYPDLARHYEKGEEISVSVDYYIKAGEKSENVLAHEDAAEMYKRALRLSEGEEENLAVMLEMYRKIARSYSLLGRFEKSRKYLAEAAKVVQDINEKKFIYMKIAETYILQRRFDTALNYLDDALSLKEEMDTRDCKILSHKGWIYIKKENLNEAERIFKKEKRIAEKFGGDKEKGQVHQDLGVISHLKKEYESAIDEFKRALEIRERLDDKIGLISLNSNIAKAYQYEQELKKAEKHFKKALEISEEIGDKVRIFYMSADLGLYKFEQGELESSLVALKRSLKIAEYMDDKGFKLLISYYLSKLYLTKGNLEDSKKHLEKCKEIMRSLDKDFLLSKKRRSEGRLKSIDYDYFDIKILIVESELKKKEGYLEEAKEKLIEGKKLAENRDEQWLLAEVYCLLGKIYSSQGCFENGKKHFEKGKEIAEEIEHE